MAEPGKGPFFRSALRLAPLAGAVTLAAVLAVRLRLAGHNQGDDFALYLRQARSVFDGDIAAVVADNRFTVLNSDPRFSPIAYPWGWPLLLSPFVGIWGLTYDRLKLVEIGVFCIWLVLLHGVVRRRIGGGAALAVVLAFATAPAYLEHTDQLLSEFPTLAALTVVVWWLDRVYGSSDRLNMQEMVITGLLIAVAVNFRREALALLVVLLAAQLVKMRATEGASDQRALRRSLWANRIELGVPFVAFAAGAVLMQLLLPADLFPDNGNSFRNVLNRWSEYPAILTDQIGLGDRPALGVAVLVVALFGVVVGARRRPRLDVPLATLAVLLALLVGTHFRQVDRYWLQVTPWVLYFAAAALHTLGSGVMGVVASRRAEPQRRAWGVWAAVVPLALLVLAHAVVLPGRLSDAREFNTSGQVQDGPAHPEVVAMTSAVSELTRPDSVVAYFRARTMSLVTDRRSFQTTDLERIVRHADYWVQRRNWSFWQPVADDASARALGLVPVWSNDRFVIWRVPTFESGTAADRS